MIANASLSTEEYLFSATEFVHEAYIIAIKDTSAVSCRKTISNPISEGSQDSMIGLSETYGIKVPALDKVFNLFKIFLFR